MQESSPAVRRQHPRAPRSPPEGAPDLKEQQAGVGRFQKSASSQLPLRSPHLTKYQHYFFLFLKDCKHFSYNDCSGAIWKNQFCPVKLVAQLWFSSVYRDLKSLCCFIVRFFSKASKWSGDHLARNTQGKQSVFLCNVFQEARSPLFV